MTEQEIERCLERFTIGKATDVMNFDYSGTLAYLQLLKAENAELRATISKMETVEKELRARIENAVELPCKVGDTVYRIHGMSNPELKKWQVKEIILTDHNFVLLLGQKRTKNCGSELSNFYNVWWFTDRVAAEARLEELKGGKQ